jgi:DNA-directed RNA polymerase subunit RPC12/RpoP
MKASEHAYECGICGRPLDERHAHDGQDGFAARCGKEVEYIVIGKRGGIADYQNADDASKTYRTDSAVLATQLGLEESSLVGSRFRCWVSPAEYGVIRGDFRLIS